MRVVIASVAENLFAGEALSLSVPTTDGVVTILPKHEPLVATVAKGTATVKTATESRDFPVTDGVLEVSNDQATVLL